MTFLIPIQYGKRKYPKEIISRVQEIATHFDKDEIDPILDYSLHTEYSFGKRKLNSGLIKKFKLLSTSHKNNVPQLWTNTDWAKEFAEFIIFLVGNKKPPKIIEIHPPFNDYCNSINEFVEIYEIFEKKILESFPNVEILIEHRSGTIYKGGNFLISTYENLVELKKIILEKQLKLRFVLDFPQLFTSYHLSTGRFTEENIKSIIYSCEDFKTFVKSIHLWGKKYYGKRLISHMGNLDTYFGNKELKNTFLSAIFNLLNDGKRRYFVPEVNSTDEDLNLIIKDLKDIGFKFI